MKYELATCTWGDEELAAIREVVESGNFTMGGKVAEFERRFADYLGARHCVMVNSGSSANLLMTAALFFRKERRLERGDEVLVPAVSWATTYTPLAQYGLRLRFVDIDLNTLNFDLDALERSLSPRTRAVLAVNLLGNSNDYGRISQMLAGRGIDLLEDNCESLGGEWEGRKLGTIGVMGTFSCYFSHHISTMEGGVVATDDDELYHILLSLRSHGWTRNLPDDNLVCSKGSDPFEESFRFVLPGYNVRPVESGRHPPAREAAALRRNPPQERRSFSCPLRRRPAFHRAARTRPLQLVWVLPRSSRRVGRPGEDCRKAQGRWH